jgi:hypothetical protein
LLTHQQEEPPELPTMPNSFSGRAAQKVDQSPLGE